jgi:hypothetical protein
MTAGCKTAVADESGLNISCAEAVGLPPTTQRHLKLTIPAAFKLFGICHRLLAYLKGEMMMY